MWHFSICSMVITYCTHIVDFLQNFMNILTQIFIWISHYIYHMCSILHVFTLHEKYLRKCVYFCLHWRDPYIIPLCKNPFRQLVIWLLKRTTPKVAPHLELPTIGPVNTGPKLCPTTVDLLTRARFSNEGSSCFTQGIKPLLPLSANCNLFRLTKGNSGFAYIYLKRSTRWMSNVPKR